MNKKLTAKIQQLSPKLKDAEMQFSSTLAIEPAEKETILKKGKIYAIYAIEGTGELNVELINKVIRDVLHDTYYQSDNISPIQSLEKAISNVNDKVTRLPANDQNKNDGIRFNIVAGVLWGNVLYVVQYGSGKSYLVRNGEIKDISATTEGNYTVASGVVKPDDVVIFSSEKFSQKFPPDKLLSMAIAPEDLGGLQASVILKFIIDTSFTDDEVVDFGVKPQKKKMKLPSLLKKKKGPKKMKEEKPNKNDAIASLVDFEKDKQPDINIKVKKSLKPKLPVKVLLPVAAFLLIGSVLGTLILRNRNLPAQGDQEGQENELTLPRTNLVNETTETQNQNEEVASESETQENTAENTDEENNIIRVNDVAFYDIKLADESATPNEIAVFNNTLVVTDSSSGKIFTSSRQTPKFEALETTFSGVKSINRAGTELGFIDNEGYKFLNLANFEITSSYTQELGNVAGTYLGNIYSIENNEIVKYVPSGGSLTSSVWSESADFANAKAISIAYSIYVLTANNDLAVYTQGTASNFEITGLPTPLENTIDMITDLNFDNIYVADRNLKSVIVLNSDGEYVRQYRLSGTAGWHDIRHISVSPDETTMYVLNGTRIYEVALDQ